MRVRMGWKGLDVMISQTADAPDQLTAIVGASLAEGSDLLRDALVDGTPFRFGVARDGWETVQEGELRFITQNLVRYARFLNVNDRAVPGILRELNTVIESRVDSLLESA